MKGVLGIVTRARFVRECGNRVEENHVCSWRGRGQNPQYHRAADRIPNLIFTSAKIENFWFSWPNWTDCTASPDGLQRSHSRLRSKQDDRNHVRRCPKPFWGLVAGEP